MARITREQYEIAIGENVAHSWRGAHLRQPNAVAVDADANVGKNRVHETIGNNANHALDRLLRANELRGAAAFHGELFEKSHVDIGPQPEGEDPPLCAAADRRQALRPLLADGRLAVGHEEEHDRQPTRRHGLAQGFAKRAFDVRAALRL